MSNELNVTSKETAEHIAEMSTGESTGVISDNKIVSIANKTGAVEPAADPIPSAAAPDSSVPVQAATPVIQAPVPDIQTSAAPAQTVTETAAAAVPAQTAAPQTTAEVPVSPASSQTTAETPAAASAQTAAEAPAQNRTQESETAPKRISGTSSYREDAEDSFDFDEDERPRKRFFRSRHEEESRDKLILSRIRDDDLLEYLALEQRRLEFLQQAKETREKRLLMAFQLLISLAAIVAVTYLLKDNPTILISILYIVGIIAALIIWKNPREKGKGRH